MKVNTADLFFEYLYVAALSVTIKALEVVMIYLDVC